MKVKSLKGTSCLRETFSGSLVPYSQINRQTDKLDHYVPYLGLEVGGTQIPMYQYMCCEQSEIYIQFFMPRNRNGAKKEKKIRNIIYIF